MGAAWGLGAILLYPIGVLADHAGLEVALATLSSLVLVGFGCASQIARHREALPLTVEEALFRVAQEALSNVARHSKATLVQITLTITDDTVSLAVLDNGQGFDPVLTRGTGILGMRERVETIGGRFHLESSPGNGTRVVVLAA